MGFFSRPEKRVATIDGPVIPPRGGAPIGAVSVDNSTAMRHSAVWACLRLRADLISTLPLDAYRDVAGIAVELPKPPIFVAPGGDRWDYQDWMYASQVDLDRAGNVIGLITETNGAGLPARIDLQTIDCCSVILKKNTGELRYRINGKEYDAKKVWHERQYVVAGCPVGLSPIAYAAWSIAESMSMQDFVLRWFGAGGVPAAHLKNTRKTLQTKEADEIKARHLASVAVGAPIVTGSDWEYKPLQSQQVGMEWLQGRQASLVDIARFLGCPADAIEAAITGGANVTYVNAVQKNLQMLIMHLGPAISRREKNLSKMLPRPRYVKLNTKALLRMDPLLQAQLIETQIRSRTLTVTEARALEDRPPLTAAQEAEFVRLFGQPTQLPKASANRTPSIPDTEHGPIRAEARVGEALLELEG